MFLSIKKSNIKSALVIYFQENSYLTEQMRQQLDNLVVYVGNANQTNSSHEINYLLRLIDAKIQLKQKQICSNDNYWLVLVKTCILIQRLLSSGVIGDQFQDVLQKIKQSIDLLHQSLQQKINKLTKKHKSHKYVQTNTNQQLKHLTFQLQIIIQKLLLPYHHYLTKRCQMLPKGFSKENKSYYLINLLNSACCCNQVIYIFARYNFDHFFIIGAFNYVMAYDVKLLYQMIRNNLIHDQHLQQSMLDEERMNEQQFGIEKVDDLVLDLHEKLFHIFYNKYHYAKVAWLVPQWIDLDAHQKDKKKLNKSKLLWIKQKQYPLDHTATSLKSIEDDFYQKKQNYQKPLSFATSSKQTFKTSSQRSKKAINKTDMQQSLQIIHDLEAFLQNCQII